MQPSSLFRRSARITSWILAALVLSAGVSSCSGSSSDSENSYKPEPLPDPTQFRAGVASLRMPVPVGMPTTGYNGLGGIKNKTPFSHMFPGTNKEHDALMLRAVALDRGPAHRVLIIKYDTVGIFQALRTAILERLKKETGEDYSDALIMAANHTHSGPARIVLSKGTFNIMSDTFFPPFYDRFIDASVQVALAAIRDLKPAELATGLAQTHDAHKDRRCENDHLPLLQENPDMPLVAVKRDGKLIALIASYAYHGTILDRDDLMLSGDMGGIVERKVAERFDHPVEVLFLNSWGADMAPASPKIPSSGAEQPAKFDQMEALGQVVADAIMPKIKNLKFSSEPRLRSETHQVVLNREAIGYEEGEFPYEYGGVFCGGGKEGNCKDDHPIGKDKHIDRHCLRFSSKDPLPQQTLFTAGWIGDLYFSSIPGEWSTSLADTLLSHMKKVTGSNKTMFIGYANDYTGYALVERDWWQAGYEASGGLWGPKQGDYLSMRAQQNFDHIFDREHTPLAFEEPEPYPAFSGFEHTKYTPERGIDVGTITKDIPATVTPTSTIVFTVLGNDPWLGTPVATLERDTGSGFKPMLRHNQTPIDTAGYEGWVELSTEPTYKEKERADQRKFLWEFHVPVKHKVPGSWNQFDGKFRFTVRIPTDEKGGTKEVHTATFEVTTPTPAN